MDLPDLLRRVLASPSDTDAWRGLGEGGEATYTLVEPLFGQLPVRSLLRALLVDLALPDKCARLSAVYKRGSSLQSALVAPVLAQLGGPEAEAALHQPPQAGPTADWVEALDFLHVAWAPAVLEEHLGPSWETLERDGAGALPTRLRRGAGLEAMVRAAVVAARAGDCRGRARVYSAAIHGIGADPTLASSARVSALLSLRTLAAPGLQAALYAAVKAGGDPGALALECLGDLGKPEVLPTLVERRRSRTGQSANAALQLLAGPLPQTDSDAELLAELDRRLPAGACYTRGLPSTLEHRIEPLRRRWPGARSDFRAVTRLPGLHQSPDALPLTPWEVLALRAFWPARSADFPPGMLHRWGRSHDPSIVNGPLPALPDLRRG